MQRYTQLKRTSSSSRQPAPKTIAELKFRAEALCGNRVGDVAHRLGIELPKENKYGKGYVGLVAECALGADPKAGEKPDFVDLGVELKTLPLNAHGRPSESTFCCAIDMAHADRETWETSRLHKKLKKVLWLPVESAKSADLKARCFGRALLWLPSEKMIAVLEQDWNLLMGFIGAGMSEELSAHMGTYLQVRPKAAHSAIRTKGLGQDGPKQVLPLGFYLRASCTEQILLESLK
jgi:DNA mismatch repair protein MutH